MCYVCAVLCGRGAVQAIGMDLDRETMPGWMALPDPKSLPDKPFEIDWIRSWEKMKEQQKEQPDPAAVAR